MIIIIRIIIVTAKEFSTAMCTFVLRCKKQSNNAEDYVLTIWKPPQFFLFSYVTIGTNYLNSENIGLN